MVTQAQISKAISLNRYYAQFLSWPNSGSAQTGWLDYYDGIVELLGLGNQSSSEAALVEAVAQWQSGCGDRRVVVDGIIGQNTWPTMQSQTPNRGGRKYRRPDGLDPTAGLTFAPPFVEQCNESTVVVPARGFLFVVVEVLPDMAKYYLRKSDHATTSKGLVRMVGILPETFAEGAKNPSAGLTPAIHALGQGGNSQFLSFSNRSHGAPSIEGRGYLVGIDELKKSGATIISESQLVRELEMHAKNYPRTSGRIVNLIRTIRGAEGEVLTSGPVRGRGVGTAHQQYLTEARKAWLEFESKQITREAMETRLQGLDRQYASARTLGRLGRCVGAIGVVFTVVDVGRAANQSYEQQSIKPIAAESIRQVGGWAGAVAGAKLGAAAGASLGLVTGPGAIITGAVGAIVVGAAFYFGADLLADKIHAN